MSGSGTYADWIAVDWGTSSLRAWAMREGAPVAEAASEAGMGRLRRNEFEPALLELIEPWLGGGVTTVTACGMVGSRQGWTEAPYATVPCPPLPDGFARAEVRDSRLSVHVVPGLKQTDPPDVMRGEETQIAGFLARSPDFDGVLCLPGTHTKWAQISAGEVISFRTFMSGELFALLSEQSVLRHSVGEGWNDDAFSEAVADTLSRPEALAQRLFGIRAADLLDPPGEGIGRARLSGFLIGAELSAARPYWLGQRVALIGAQALSSRYATALLSQGLTAEVADATDCTLAGLAAAHDRLKETAT